MQRTRPTRLWVLGSLLFSIASALGAAVPAGWEQQSSPVDDDLQAAFFLDDTTGWVLAHESGVVLYTEDGGTTWSERGRVPRGFEEAIVFADAYRGWVCGEGGGIFRTTDGGTSWSKVSWSDSGTRRDDTQWGHVVLLGDGRALALGFHAGTRAAATAVSDDGGASWAAGAAPPTGGGFTDARATTPGGHVAGGFGAVHRLAGGATVWSTAALGSDDAVRGLAALDGLVWAVGARGLMAQSDDGGVSWSRLPAITRASLRGVLFVDPEHGYIVGDFGAGQGVLYETTDGGARWRRIGGELPALRAIVRGGDRLWIVGDAGIILSRRVGDPADAAREPAEGGAEADESGADPAGDP